MESPNDHLIANLETWRRLYRELRSVFVPRPTVERITRLGHDYRLLLDQYMDTTDATVKAFCLSQMRNLSLQMRQLLHEHREAFEDVNLTIKEIACEPSAPPPGATRNHRAGRKPRR